MEQVFNFSKSTVGASLLVLALIAQSVMGQTNYSVKDLGVLQDLPFRSDSGPSSINNSGVVAGANVTNGVYRAMVYDSTWRELGTLGGTESISGGINAAGSVAGYSQTLAGGTNAFLWNASATNGVPGNPQMIDLGTLGGAVSEAFSINNSGQVSGYSDVSFHDLTQQHAFLYSGGTMTDIGALLSSLPNSFGYAVNGLGHVAGAAYDVAYSSPQAFFFNGTTATDLGTFGGNGATVLALNDSDTLAGYLTTTSMVDHAFCFLTGKLNDLGTLGGNYSYARSINNSNIVVGGSFVDTNDLVYHAFVWSPAFALQDLNAQLDSSGAGWVLNEARAINDAGQIAGVGTLNGVNHAFLLTPFAPTTTNASPPELTVSFEDQTNMVLRFASIAGIQYTVQTNGSAATAGWGNTGTILTGTGGIMSVTNSALTVSPLFYRVKASAP